MFMQDAARGLVAAIDARLGFKPETSGSFLAPKGASWFLRAFLWVFQFIVMTAFMTYAGSAFMLFELNKGATVYSSLFWAGHVVTVVAFVLAALIAPVPERASKKKSA
jgi:hypothetical protein